MIHNPERLSQRQLLWIQLAIVFFALAMFTFGLWGVEDFIAFDSRFALFIKEMFVLGPSFFPTTYGGQPYPDYPATATFLAWVASVIAGKVNMLTAALPSAIAATLTLVLTFRLLAGHSVCWALLAVCFELLSIDFVIDTRVISLDHMVACITLSCYFFADSYLRSRSVVAMTLLFVLLVVGFSVRGPIGVVIPTAAVTTRFLLDRRWGLLIGVGIGALGVIAVGWFGQLALARIDGGQSFVDEVIRMQVTLRMGEQASHTSPFFYFKEAMGGYALTYPLAVLALFAALSGPRSPEREIALRFAAFAGIILVGLSLAHERKMRYILPAIPPLAVLASYPLIMGGGGRYARFVAGLVRYLLLWFPLTSVALVLIARQYALKKGVDLTSVSVGLCLFLSALQIASLASLRIIAPRWTVNVVALLAVISLWAVNVVLVEPGQREIRNTRLFTLAVEEPRKREQADLVMFGLSKDGMAIKYMVNADVGVKPVFVNDAAKLVDHKRPFYLVVPTDMLENIPDTVLAGSTKVADRSFDGKPFVGLRVGASSDTH